MKLRHQDIILNLGNIVPRIGNVTMAVLCKACVSTFPQTESLKGHRSSGSRRYPDGPAPVITFFLLKSYYRRRVLTLTSSCAKAVFPRIELAARADLIGTTSYY